MRVDKQAAPTARRIHKRGQMKKAHNISVKKSPGIIKLESRLETSGAIALSLDPRVRSFRPQPMTIDMNTGRLFHSKEHLYRSFEGSRVKPRPFTPDFEVTLQAGGTRRMIRAKIEKALDAGLRGPWANLQDVFRELLEGLPARSERAGGLESYLDRIKAFSASVEQSFEMAFDWPAESDADHVAMASKTTNMKPTSLENDTHTLTTNEPNPVISNRFETKHTEGVVPEPRGTEPVERLEEVDLDISWSTHGTKRGSDIDIPMLMASCPHFAEMARSTQGYMRDWNDVHRAAAALRPIVGISEDAWNVANKVLGPAVAAASIALILDKSTNGEVKSPGGYLRGLVERAQIGELHLDRSFYGRLNAAGT